MSKFNWGCRPAGLPVAVLAVHGTDDVIIPYAGGPKFNSPIFVMYSEPGSNEVWATHNGCTGGVAATNVSANYSNKGVQATGVSTHHVYGGCHATAPVECIKRMALGMSAPRRSAVPRSSRWWSRSSRGWSAPCAPQQVEQVAADI